MAYKKMKKYKTIYADPPWLEQGCGKCKRGADKYYQLMKTEEIIEMSDWIKSISEENAHLYLWVTNNFLKDGLKVMEAWGFRYITIITWIKDKIGMGQYFRGQTEQCLFGVKGRLPYKLVDGKRSYISTALHSPRGRHSEKPYKMYEIIERVSYPPYIELFARTKNELFKREDWDYWGNEA